MLAAGGCGTASPVVKKVDHVATMSDNPQDLFKTMTETFGLPLAWPYAEYPGFETAGVQAGNVNLELLHFGPLEPKAAPEAFFWGVVIEPYPLAESVPELEKLGAEPQKPEVQMGMFNGKPVKEWTNVTLKALSPSQDYTVYLNVYEPAVKAKLEGKKITWPQGPFGIVETSEIVIMSKDAKALKETWAKAFAPNKFEDDTMAIGTGPAITIEQGSNDVIASLVFKVQSLSKAKSALEKAGILGKTSATVLNVNPEKVQGLNIVMVQK